MNATGLEFAALSTLNTADTDLQDDIGEEEFEEFFGLPPVTDPKEKARREKALKANEASIKEQNKKFEDQRRHTSHYYYVVTS